MGFWLEDPTVLIRDGNYYQFVPSDKMSRIEQLNALSRFFIYFYILASMFNKEDHIKNIPVMGLFLVVVVYYIHHADKQKDDKDVARERNKRNKKIQEETKELEMINEDPTLNEGFDKDVKETEDKLDYDVEVGYYDPNGKLTFPNDLGVPKYVRRRDHYPELSADEVVQLQKQTCKKPTNDNPFMNPSLTDYGNGEVPVACNADDKDINDKMEMGFNMDLYKDIEDLWDKKNSQRQFYVLPNTKVPNDQESFANWCYNSYETCKEDQVNCLRYEDLRFKRPYGSTNL